MPDKRNNLHAIGLSIIMVALASAAAAATKIATENVSALVIVAAQYVVCLLISIPLVLRSGVSSLQTSRWGMHIFRGLIGVLGFGLYYSALEHTPLVDAVLLRQSAPLCVPLVLWLWQKQGITYSGWLPIIIGFVGVVLILSPSGDEISIWHVAGFFSALTLAISMVATHKLASTEPGQRILFYYFVISLICVLPLTLGQWSSITGRDWALMLFIGIAMYCTLWLYTRAYSMATANVIAPINYIAVVFSGLIGWGLWGHIPNDQAITGIALVIAGGLLTLYLSQRETADSPLPVDP
ncbi:MAG: DMT family transporter [Pseudomonadales bacterium]